MKFESIKVKTRKLLENIKFYLSFDNTLDIDKYINDNKLNLLVDINKLIKYRNVFIVDAPNFMFFGFKIFQVGIISESINDFSNRIKLNKNTIYFMYIFKYDYDYNTYLIRYCSYDIKDLKSDIEILSNKENNIVYIVCKYFIKKFNTRNIKLKYILNIVDKYSRKEKLINFIEDYKYLELI